MALTPEQPLVFHRDTLLRIRDVLLAVDYSTATLEKLIGEEQSEFTKTDVRKWPDLVRRVSGQTPLEILVCVFFFGVKKEISVFESVIAPTSLEDWTRVGLVTVEGNSVRALWRLVTFDSHFYVLDAPWIIYRDRKSLTMPPSPSSQRLAHLTIRKPFESAVDIGTGTGYQAFHAAAHSRSVVATDYSARAVALAEFNAALNNLNIEFLEGDCFQPVEGRKFDLVISNPPYIISPGGDHVFRDSGRPGDQFSERIIREAPSHLNPGGYATILINWVERTGENWRDRLYDWVKDSGCDAYVLFSPGDLPGVYATAWNPEDDVKSENFLKKYLECIAFFERERVQRIYGGAVILRKRAGMNWFVCEEAPNLLGNAGNGIAAEMERFDFLLDSTDQALLNTRFRISPDLHLSQSFVAGDTGLKPDSYHLKLRRGLLYGGLVGGNLFAIVSRIRPDTTLGAILQNLATTWNEPLDKVVAGAMPTLREMIFHGMFTPVPPA